jgi:Flp pilus assembly pilin Flp
MSHVSPTTVFRVMRQLLAEDTAQDLVEYALLAAFVGIAGWAVLMIIPETIGATYESWIDADSGVPSLWDPPEPQSSGS